MIPDRRRVIYRRLWRASAEQICFLTLCRSERMAILTIPFEKAEASDGIPRAKLDRIEVSEIGL